MGQPMLLLCLLLSASARAAAWLDGAAPQPAGFGGPRSSFAPRAGGQRRRGGHAQPPPQPRVQLRAEEAEHVFDVTKYGAVGDNATDDTAAFDKALKAAFASGGGMVQVPPGLWVLAGNLTVPPGVSLTGSYRVVPSHDLRSNQPITDGTVLIPTGGRGSIGCEPSADPEDPESPSKEPDLDCEEAFITIAENGLVQGLVVWYKEQERIATPVPYPWTFFLGDPKKEYNKGGSADNAAIMDVEVLGCWNCIAAVEAHRHYIARIQGHPINIGVFVDATYDIGRIEDVHFNPWYSDGHPFYWWQTTHGRAFVFGRSDWEYVFNTFAFAYSIGYHFIERATGSMNGNFLGIGMDAATNASVQVDQSQPYGILITNGEFTAFCDVGHSFCPPQTPNGSQFAPVHVRVLPGNEGAVKFITSSFWGPASAVAIADGIGTVSFTECHFDSWDHHLNANGSAYEHNGSPAVEQIGGTLILSGNEFRQVGSQLSIADGGPFTKTIVAENIIKGPLKIINDANKLAKVIVANNADGPLSPDDTAA